MGASVSKLRSTKRLPSRNKEYRYMEAMATTAVRLIRQLLRKYPDFTVAVGCGNMIHETLLFVRRMKKDNTIWYSFVHYNPNWQEELKVLSKMLTLFSLKYKIQGYHPPNGNPHGEYTSLAWAQAHRFIRRKFDFKPLHKDHNCPFRTCI